MHGETRTGARRLRRAATLAVAGLAATALPAAAATPARLAYVTGLAGTRPSAWVANADGSGARRLGPGSDALISPDGAQVAIVSPYGRQGVSLSVRPASGGPARTLVPANESIGQLAWSPDATRLAAVVNGSRLLTIDVAGGTRTVLARGQIQGASFSPHSDRIAYGRARGSLLSSPVDVYVASAGGGGAQAITRDGRSLWPVWGPTQIAYTHERLRRRDAPVYQLRTMRPDGVIGAGLSPDGSTVLVQRGYFDDPRHQSVATIPFAGGRAAVLVRHGSAPSWGG